MSAQNASLLFLSTFVMLYIKRQNQNDENTVPYEKNTRLLFEDLSKGFSRNFKRTKNQKNCQNNNKETQEAYGESSKKNKNIINQNDFFYAMKIKTPSFYLLTQSLRHVI